MFYRGTLNSKLIIVKNKKLIISTPLQEGKLNLLLVGNILQVSTARSTEQIGFQTEILALNFQPERTITIISSHAISHSGDSIAHLSAVIAPSADINALHSLVKTLK